MDQRFPGQPWQLTYVSLIEMSTGEGTELYSWFPSKPLDFRFLIGLAISRDRIATYVHSKFG